MIITEFSIIYVCYRFSKASTIHLEPNTLKQNEAYDTAETDQIYDDVSETCKVSIPSTEDGAQNMLSQHSPSCGDDGIEIIYEGVSSTVCADTKGRDGDSSNCCVTEMQGSDGENDYYVNDP